MSHFFSDFDNKTRQREKMRAEIDSLLSNDATKVQDVFELDSTEKQDEIMGQLTVGGKNVMKFFTQRKRLSELIDYITVMPDSTCSKNRGHKYPFLAHHIFTEGGDGVTEIIDKFFFSYSDENTLVNNQNTESKDQSNQDQSTASAKKIEKTNSPGKNSESEIINGSASPPSKLEQKDSTNNQEQINTTNQTQIPASSAPIKQEQESNIKKEENPQGDQNQQKINQENQEQQIIKDEDLDQDREEQEFEFEDALDQQFEDLADEQTFPESEKMKLNFDQIIEQFENPKNTKKSFELRYQNDDDDDEIYIVNDGEEDDQEENDQNDLFLDPPSLSFNIIEDKDVQQKKDEQSPTNEFVDISKELEQSSKELEEITKDDYNPFKDNLANSEKIPVTQKLEEVQIQEDYLGQSQDENNISTFTQKLNEANQQNQKHDILSKSAQLPATTLEEQNQQIESLHQEKINLRKRQKKQSLSIHRLDEATQKSINDTVEKERQRLIVVDDTDPKTKIEPDDNKDSKPKKKVAFQIVEDHVKISPNTQKVESNNPFENDKLDNNTTSDELNDRVEDDQDSDEFKDCATFNDNEIITPQNIVDDEEDNILRKIPLKVQIAAPVQEQIEENKTKEVQDLELSPESPSSPCSPDMLITPKFKEQNSIEIEQIIVQPKVEKKQDYSLINQFFSFLDIKTEKNSKKEYLNDTLSGYFCRVCLVIVSQEPKELMKYMEQTNYQIIDKLLDHMENKSISELIVKFLDEIIKQIVNQKEGVPPILQESQQNLAASVPNLKAAEEAQAQLQQSGQSSEKIEKDNKIEAHIVKIKGIIISILENKFDEEADYLEKINALEILQELLKNKICYQVLTTKKSFEIMTTFLVSDDVDCKRNVYTLLKYLIQNYEKHERFEKRINIDNFEDEEVMTHSGSGSGILNRSKRSKGSKKQNQDVLKDIQESDLFQFIRVVVKEITSQEIETKFDQINSAKQSNKTLPLGMLFISVIEFIEKSSSIFSGFYNDINQTLIDKDIFNYIFEILEFYPNSDILNQTVTKIFQSIMKSKNEDVPEMLKYLLEETKLITFLIKNGPKCNMIETKSLKDNTNPLSKSDNIIKPSSPNQKEKKNIEGEQVNSKSPEQSSQVVDVPVESSLDKSKQFKMQVPCKNSSGLQAHVKQISDILIELSNISVSNQDKTSKSNTEGVIKDKSHGQEQSGDQSKSSEIIMETDDDQLLQQSISKVVSLNLNENSQWVSFVHHQIDPINQLQKGKLCQDNETSGFNSDNQIFDDDFIRSNVQEDNNNEDQFKGKNNALDKLSEEFDNIIGSLDNNKSEENGSNNLGDDEEDHQKFFKKMQECFSSNLNKRIGKNQNHVDNDEREMKQHAYQNIAEGINSQLRESLTDQHIDRFFPKSQGRERSSSSEFSNHLPPLQNYEDHKDEQGKNEYSNYKTVRPYDKKDNEEDQNNIDDQGFQKISADPDVSAIATVDDDEEQFTAQENKAMQSLTDDLRLDDVDINLDDSDEYENINNRSSPNKTPNQNDDLKDFDDFAQNLEKVINEEVNRLSDQMGEQMENGENMKKIKEIDEIKNIFDKIDEFDNMFETAEQEIEAENKNKEQQQQKKDNFGSKSVFEPKLNNFMQESNHEQIEIQQLAKSEYIKQQPNLILNNEDCVPEFQDNQFWKIINPFQDELDIDKLIEDFNE